MNLSKLQEMVKDRVAWHATVHAGESGPTEWWNNDTFYLQTHNIECKTKFSTFYHFPKL